MSLNKTKIEWTDYTWNPVTGCKHGCPYCYARSIANRFKGSKAWPNGFEPTFHPDRLDDIWNLKLLGKKVFVCSVADLLGSWVPEEWILATIASIDRWTGSDGQIVENAPIFQFLTKNPKRYVEFDFPKNCWLGTTVESEAQAHRIDELVTAVSGNVRYVSFEPLLGEVKHSLEGIDWMIIGAQTGPGARALDEEIITGLLEKAELAGIPTFTKDNLDYEYPLRMWPGDVERTAPTPEIASREYRNCYPSDNVNGGRF